MVYGSGRLKLASPPPLPFQEKLDQCRALMLNRFLVALALKEGHAGDSPKVEASSSVLGLVDKWTWAVQMGCERGPVCSSFSIIGIGTSDLVPPSFAPPSVLAVPGVLVWKMFL